MNQPASFRVGAPPDSGADFAPILARTASRNKYSTCAFALRNSDAASRSIWAHNTGSMRKAKHFLSGLAMYPDRSGGLSVGAYAKRLAARSLGIGQRLGLLAQLHQTGRFASIPKPLRIGATMAQDELIESGKHHRCQDDCRDHAQANQNAVEQNH